MPIQHQHEANLDMSRNMSMPGQVKSPWKKLHLPSSFGSCPCPTTIRKTTAFKSVINNRKRTGYLSSPHKSNHRSNCNTVHLQKEDGEVEFDMNTSRDSHNTRMSSLSIETSNPQRHFETNDRPSDGCTISRAVWLSPVLNSKCNNHTHASFNKRERKKIQVGGIKKA